MAVKRKKQSSTGPVIDLHGYTVREAEEATLQFLSDLVLAGEKRAVIIHGHGSGKVKAAVHRVLAASGLVSHFEVNFQNTGETKIRL
ncbi:MAG: hypothetical protein D6719_11260 [Candidatus Dadabacteria bacterium]|nr:MAG: hypothetical protein D6719_11260 [Candidatus Dadabacteria bacterium]